MIQEIHQPTTIDEAVALLKRDKPRTIVLNGGTFVNSDLRDTAQAVVDISQLNLTQIQRSNNALTLGASVTLQHIIENAASAIPHDPIQLLAQAAMDMAAINVRNQATIGGAIVTCDASSPLVTALLACDATLTLNVGESKTMPLAGFLSYRSALLDQGALITSVQMPLVREDTQLRYHKVARTLRDYPIVCVAAQYALNKGILGAVRVAVGGVADTPVRLNALEFAIEKKPIEQLDVALKSAVESLAPPSNYLGSAEYRREMARTLTKRCFEN